jgi:hypothetical protein
LISAAEEKARAYALIESCFEKVRDCLERLTLEPANVSPPLRDIYLRILVDIIAIFGIATTYVKRGGIGTVASIYLI